MRSRQFPFLDIMSRQTWVEGRWMNVSAGTRQLERGQGLTESWELTIWRQQREQSWGSPVVTSLWHWGSSPVTSDPQPPLSRVNIVNLSYLYERSKSRLRPSLLTHFVTSSVAAAIWLEEPPSQSQHSHHSPLLEPCHVSRGRPRLFLCPPEIPWLLLAGVPHVWCQDSCQRHQLTSTHWHLTVQCCTVLYCALQHTILQELPGASVSIPWFM